MKVLRSTANIFDVILNRFPTEELIYEDVKGMAFHFCALGQNNPRWCEDTHSSRMMNSWSSVSNMFSTQMTPGYSNQQKQMQHTLRRYPKMACLYPFSPSFRAYTTTSQQENTDLKPNFGKSFLFLFSSLFILRIIGWFNWWIEWTVLKVCSLAGKASVHFQYQWQAETATWSTLQGNSKKPHTALHGQVAE